MMEAMGKCQPVAMLVEDLALDASKVSIRGPGPSLPVHTLQRTIGGRDTHMMKLGVKGVDGHPEVLWIVVEIATSIVTEPAGGQGALAKVGIEVKSSEIGNP